MMKCMYIGVLLTQLFSAVVGLCGVGVCRPHGGGLCHRCRLYQEN